MPLTAAMRTYLFTGRFPPPDVYVQPSSRDWWDVRARAKDKAVIRADWARVRDELLRIWIGERPGTRPWAWWQFDAPRWARCDLPPRLEGLGDNWLLWLAEPRRRLGGIGTPTYEVLNEAPSLQAGLPTRWVTARDEAYYNGRARDIYGQRIGTEYHEGDFSGLAPRAVDPPRFESEAAYLQRHGLLFEHERHRLPPNAFAPTVIAVTAGGSLIVTGA
jgi:hypothetical protein